MLTRLITWNKELQELEEGTITKSYTQENTKLENFTP